MFVRTSANLSRLTCWSLRWIAGEMKWRKERRKAKDVPLLEAILMLVDGSPICMLFNICSLSSSGKKRLEGGIDNDSSLNLRLKSMPKRLPDEHVFSLPSPSCASGLSWAAEVSDARLSAESVRDPRDCDSLDPLLWFNWWRPPSDESDALSSSSSALEMKMWRDAINFLFRGAWFLIITVKIWHPNHSSTHESEVDLKNQNNDQATGEGFHVFESNKKPIIWAERQIDRRKEQIRNQTGSQLTIG